MTDECRPPEGPAKWTWRASVWDRPRNGTRYYVCRGEEAAGTADGGVYTFKSRQAAKKYAEQLNARIAEPPADG
jgi:hypothetical protein